mmetsp:Transcript_25398/g.46072  ORF Transcript_25398/g.46072 Transcript_25398/m.46072 type:complete len:628 (+) Transcript_25398:60-1943(+)|eukprot:CAMPEP_0197628814 /NCGR_PEP_ID=MMETSP1338-20131121/6951_1 /TAXON_ID=43686 ORGANISM="Pelagodinium beii, Strain RCC1491" /NCGR_SAMPLE_ID=MMETSP1338 /ASSEMBLY_ACC=CAM_ASM_000754 /LENGTH=627 /DNA_ID=CAMNT_0043199813 /DNA_START=60 /DNA_END=1943 /DNA_ORIENTATION=+
MCVLFGGHQGRFRAATEDESHGLGLGSSRSRDSWTSLGTVDQLIPGSAFGRGGGLKRSSSTGDEDALNSTTLSSATEASAKETPGKTRGRPVLRRADYIMKVFSCSSRLPRSKSPSTCSSAEEPDSTAGLAETDIQVQHPTKASLLLAFGSRAVAERLRSRQRPKKQPGLVTALPDKEVILQELERCKMQLEDTWKPPTADPEEKQVKQSSGHDGRVLPPAPMAKVKAAPLPDQLPSPGLRLLGPAASPALQRSFSYQRQRAFSADVCPTSRGQYQMTSLQAEKQLQLAREAADVASLAWPGLHTPSARFASSTWAHAGEYVQPEPGMEQAVSVLHSSWSWGDVSTSVGCTRADRLTARGDVRRRASTTDSVTRAPGCHLREAQDFLSQMLEVAEPGTSCARNSQNGWTHAANRRWHRVQRPSSASSALGAGECAVKDKDSLRPLNGSLPGFPGLEVAASKMTTPEPAPLKNVCGLRTQPVLEEQPEKELSPGEAKLSEAGSDLTTTDTAFCKLLVAALSEPSTSSPISSSVTGEARASLLPNCLYGSSPTRPVAGDCHQDYSVSPLRRQNSATTDVIKETSPKSSKPAAISPQCGLAQALKPPKSKIRPKDFAEAVSMIRRTEDTE